MNPRLTYCIEFLYEGLTRREYVYAIDSQNGVILDCPEGQNHYIGRTIAGGLVSIPVEAVTNVFQALKETVNNGQGYKTVHLTGQAEKNRIEGAMERPEQWDENGTLKNVEYEDKVPEGAKRVIR